jgi:hypothetical protein
MFDDLTIAENNPAYHLITTDHPFMDELGLSVFTLEVLYKWWDIQDARGQYINRKIIAPAGYYSGSTGEGDSTKEDSPKRLLIPEDKEHVCDSWGTFFAWRRENDSGKFEQKGILDAGKVSRYKWDFKESVPHSPTYLYGDLDWSSFDNRLHDSVQWDTIKGISPITNLIAMNDYIRLHESDNPKRDDWGKKEKAIYEFITDIKASKYKCVHFSNSVNFNVNLAEGTTKCSKEDWIDYKLYLFDDAAPRRTARTATFASTKLVAPPSDALNRSYSGREDGEIFSFQNGPGGNQGRTAGKDSKKVAADLDVQYNELTNKWESGTRQIIAKATTDLPKARFPMGTDELMTIKVKEDMLEKPESKSNHIVYGSGLAMPIMMQNGNPSQWAPSYASPGDCRPDETKAIVKVFNPDPKTEYPKDTVLILNQIDGLWIATGKEGQITAPEPVFDGKWDFTYLATNSQYYFRDNLEDWNKVSPRQAEKIFHWVYYGATLYPGGRYGGGLEAARANQSEDFQLVTDGTVNKFSFQAQGADGSTKMNTSYGKYYQFSSFDFMDKHIGGTRGDTRSLSTTQFATDPMGNDMISAVPGIDGTAPSLVYEGLRFSDWVPSHDGAGQAVIGAASGPFFGCVFPDGYNDPGVSTYKAPRTFHAKSYQNFVGSVFFGNGHNKEILIKDTDFPFNDGTARMGTDDFVTSWSRSDPEKTWLEKSEDGTQERAIAMFEADDVFLKHLPADIGTNASPDGINGRPISHIQRIPAYYAGESYSMTEAVFGYFKARAWMYKGEDDSDSYKDSAFDFKPAKPSTIQFRPLKAEVYASFDLVGIADNWLWGDGSNWRELRANFGYESYRINRSKKMPASRASYDREALYRMDGYNSLWVHNANGSVDSHVESHRYFTNVEGTTSSYPNGLKFTRADIPTKYIPPTTRVNEGAWGDDIYWTCPSCADRGIGEPYNPGAVGIIGAIATAGSNGSFVFHTNNYLGIPGWTRSKFHKPSWGGNNLQYDDFATTNLSVTIYQAWPREQTIYDPRFFAVHHFNPGISRLEDDGTYTNVQIEPLETEETEVNGWKYRIDKEGSTVDFRVPSIADLLQPAGHMDDYDAVAGGLDNLDKVYTPTSLLTPYPVFSDGVTVSLTIDETPNPGEYVIPLLSEEYWNIDTRRRGKCLPYYYRLPAIGVPLINSLNTTKLYTGTIDEGTYANPENPGGEGVLQYPKLDVDGTPVTDVEMVWTDIGEGYEKDDELTVSGHESVRIRIATVDGGGSVTSFIVEHQGTGIPSSSCEASDTLLYPHSQGGLRVINTDEAHGTGFQAYFPQGVIHTGSILEDKKPAIATEDDIHELSTPSDPRQGSQGASAGNTSVELTVLPIGGGVGWTSPAAGFGTQGGGISAIDPLAGTRDTTVYISNPSTGVMFEENNLEYKYDLFFHFHNDVAHTFMSTWDRYGQGAETAIENYIEVSIAAGESLSTTSAAAT